MTISSIEALVIRMPSAPARHGPLSAYPARDIYPAKPEQALETVLARVTTDSGVTGWGESQALSAPEVAGTIIHSILKPELEGKEFSGTGLEIETFWNAMYSRMRLSGQPGGFMLDAIAAVDIALWDLAGKLNEAPISSLIAPGGAKKQIDSYVNHLGGETASERVECARSHHAAGCRRFKIFHESSRRDLFETYDALAAVCGPENIAVDALWRLEPSRAASFGSELDRRGALWLECPFNPEDPAPHAALGARIATPIAIGETYRTHHELASFFRARAMKIVQPDLGRCGITEALRIARAAERAGLDVVPHITAALGPLLFATVQFAAAAPNCRMAPYAPDLLATANGYSAVHLAFRDGSYDAPMAPGLGLELRESDVRLMAAA